MLYAQFVRNLPHPSHIVFFIAAILFPVFHGNRVPHNRLWMHLVLRWVLTTAWNFPPNSRSANSTPIWCASSGGDFSGSKTLHQMESLYAFFLMAYLFDLTHILIGRVYGRADGWLEQILFWLVFIESLIDLSFQRSSVFGTGRFFLIESIVDGVIKAVDGDNAGIYDSGFLLVFWGLEICPFGVSSIYLWSCRKLLHFRQRGKKV